MEPCLSYYEYVIFVVINIIFWWHVLKNQLSIHAHFNSHVTLFVFILSIKSCVIEFFLYARWYKIWGVLKGGNDKKVSLPCPQAGSLTLGQQLWSFCASESVLSMDKVVLCYTYTHTHTSLWLWDGCTLVHWGLCWRLSLPYRNVSRRRKWQPTPVFLPGESHGQRILASYSP